MITPPHSDTARRFGGRLAVLYAFLAVLVLGPRLLVDETLFERDITMVWLPMADTVARLVGAGEAPLWDPYRGFGQPLLADPRAQVLYPPAWLNLVVPSWRSYSLLALFHLWLGGIGAYRLARSLGGSRHAAGTAGAAFLVSGPFVALAATWHHQAAAAWIPWIFHAAVRGRGRTLAAALCAQVFAGSPEITGATLALALLGVAIAVWAAAPVNARAIASGVVAGLALSAVQWVPTVAFAWDAARDPSGARWALHPVSLIELVAPIRLDRWALSDEAVRLLFQGVQPWLMLRYLGVCAVIAACGAAFGPEGSSRAIVRGLLALAMLSIAATTAGHGLLASAPDWPLISALRYPSKALIFAALFISVAAGLSLDRLGVAPIRRASVAGFVALGAAFGLGVQVAITRGIDVSAASAGDLPRVVVSVLALAALAGAARRRAAVVSFALVADLFVRSQGLHAAAPHDLFRERPEAVENMKAGSRVYVEDYSIASGAPRHGTAIYRPVRGPAGWSIEAAASRAVLRYLNPPTAGRWGLRGSFDADILDFQDAGLKALVTDFRRSADPDRRRRFLQMAGVDYVATLGEDAGSRDLPLQRTIDLGLGEPMRLHAVPVPLARDAIAGACRPSHGRPPLDLLSDPTFDFRREVWLEDCPPEGPSDGGWLVTLEAFDAGWTARVNGRPAEVHRANGVFRAVRVPTGPVDVVYRYRPLSLAAGAAVSAVALGLLAVRKSKLLG